MARQPLALFALLMLAACQQPGAPAPDYRPGEAGTVDHALCLLGFTAIPLREVDPGHHLIDATINGQTGSFVLDTGANVSVITVSKAERFGLSAGGRGAPGGGGNARQVSVDGFEIGAISVRQRRVVVADLEQLLTALSAASGTEVVGIIGQDVLEEHRAIIDVARPMLYLIEEDRDPAPVSADRCQPPEGEQPG